MGEQINDSIKDKDLQKIVKDIPDFPEKVGVEYSKIEAEKINAFKGRTNRAADIDKVEPTNWELTMGKKKLFDDKIKMVPVMKLKINPYQSYYFNKGDGGRSTHKKEHLKASIKKYGIKVPIQITQDFIIIGGHSRHSIALELDFEKVPCTMATYKLKDHELRLHTLEDNYLQKRYGIRTEAAGLY